MNTNIVISLDTRRKKKNGTYPLVMRLGHNERTTSIPLGISIEEKDWDAKSRNIRKSYVGTSSVTRLNNLIQKKKSEAMDIVMKLHESGVLSAMSLTDLRERIDKPMKGESFFKFMDRCIEELKTGQHYGTARMYEGVLQVLKHFWDTEDLLFRDITYKFLTRFEAQHLGKGNSMNTISAYLRTVRAVYNRAIKSGLIEKSNYPFEEYTIKRIPTEKRALDWELLKKIIEKDLEPNHECFNARNYFLASYMMYGMSFIDMAFLKKSDIQDGRIVYRRKKTGKIYDIKITTHLDAILSPYIALNPDSEYIFPILKRDTLLLQHKDVISEQNLYNTHLKALAKHCGIDKKLTSYVSRHSFATQAMLQHVPINAISTMLGHTSLKTTEIYLKTLPTNILDEYNAMIMQG